MCGIAGSVRAHGAPSRQILETQLRLLDHRGPDSWGAFGEGRGAIGQTRLAIIDVVTGDPPITDESGRVGVALNGEIYNFAELRKELVEQGHRMKTSGDTEVLAHLGEDLDPVALARRLDGMFAFAIWDGRSERLVLGRDRLGKKPLYWWYGGGQLVFGSEIKAVLAHPAVSAGLNERAVPAYLTFGYVPTPHTFFEGVQSLAPGHVLSFVPGGAPVIEQYWAPRVPGADDVEVLDIGAAEAAAATRDLLAAAVRRRLVADVPLGAFLSGGVDSSAVVALMAAHSEQPVRTFTIGFEEAGGFDERRFARLVAERYATDHTELVVGLDAVGLVERLAWHHDQPFGDSSSIPTFLLSEMTRHHVTVTLCGDGGDELFAGYERFGAALAAARWATLPTPLRRGAASLLAAAPDRGRLPALARFARGAAQPLPEAYLSWVRLVQSDALAALVPDADRWAEADWRSVWDRSAGAATLPRLLDLNLRTYLLDDLLPKVDRASMAHALEVRAPFLDDHLLEFALRLPPRLHIRGFRLKRVLKEAVRDLVPPEILCRRKKGFGVPVDGWFREGLGGYVDAMLGPGARVRGHLAGDALDIMLGAHRSGQERNGQALWALLMLEAFLRKQDW